MRHLRAFCIAALIALPTLGVYGQQTGEITGTVTDPSSAVVTGATVTATNTATQQARTRLATTPAPTRSLIFSPAFMTSAPKRPGSR